MPLKAAENCLKAGGKPPNTYWFQKEIDSIKKLIPKEYHVDPEGDRFHQNLTPIEFPSEFNLSRVSTGPTRNSIPSEFNLSGVPTGPKRSSIP
ncbi:hypothetical protein PoB_007278100 [Plakobranchus ocellatus]|uniref:Uncharacterized protein n=1 Tax=Plakobranchus ocellatus TaxID=259542 RepID=A0AAV4DQY2_9GAST|nr:hypothetical protein PoB_007278100 [Plakobranchus ocellatus]